MSLLGSITHSFKLLCDIPLGGAGTAQYRLTGAGHLACFLRQLIMNKVLNICVYNVYGTNLRLIWANPEKQTYRSGLGPLFVCWVLLGVKDPD